MERRRDKERIKEPALARLPVGRRRIRRAVDEALLAYHRLGGRPGRAAVAAGLPAGVLEDRLRGDQLPPLLRYQRTGRAAHRDRRRSSTTATRRRLELVRSGKVTGLRIDHIDGLWDPGVLPAPAAEPGRRPKFTSWWRRSWAATSRCRREWPVAGTTGYEFLNARERHLHRSGRARRRWRRSTPRRTGNHLPFAELCYQATSW